MLSSDTADSFSEEVAFNLRRIGARRASKEGGEPSGEEWCEQR